MNCPHCTKECELTLQCALCKRIICEHCVHDQDARDYCYSCLRNLCPCGSGKYSEWEHDAKGIPLCRCCDDCRTQKLSGYRPEILTGYSQRDVDEPIEPE